MALKTNLLQNAFSSQHNLVGMHKRKFQLPKFDTRAQFAPGSVNAESRTVDLIFSAGGRVLRSSWFDGPYFEELSLDPAHVRMERLNSGAPLLNSHNAYDLEDQIGVVERAWIEDGKGHATVRFSKANEKAVKIWQDVQDGIVRNVSVGYATHKFEQVEGGDESTPVFRATDWEPMELSLTPIPADAGAQVRSAEKQELFECEFVRKSKKEGSLMTPEEIEALKKREADAKKQADEAKAAAAEQVRAATQAAATRATEILSLVRKHKLDQGFAEELIAQPELTLDGVRAAVLAKLETKTPALDVRNSDATVTHDEVDTMRKGMESALLARANPNKYKAEGSALEYRGMSLKELAREALEKRGVRTRGMNSMKIAELALKRGGMHTTSDFPLILGNVADRILRDSYAEVPITYGSFVRERDVPDFREITSVQVGDFPKFEKVNEHGEFKRGSMGEAGEKYKLETFGKIVAVTRQLLINDDLGAFTDLIAKAGKTARYMIVDAVYNNINSNPIMGDGKTLFHADHGNLVAGRAAIKDGLPLLRQALRQQKGIDGNRITVTPRTILIGVERETEAEAVVSPLIIPQEGANVNTFARSLGTVSDQQLAAVPYYLVASDVPVVEIAYLEGQREVYLETREGFDIDGMEVKARLDFATKAVDWRGIAKNPGVNA